MTERGTSSSAEAVDVAVCIVTHDSADDLPGCFAHLEALRPAPAEVVIVDCASRDDSVAVSEAWAANQSGRMDLRVEVVPLGRNAGFAGGMNEAIGRTSSAWVLSLNPDAGPAPDFLGRLLERAASCEASADGNRVGALTPRLVRPAADSAPPRLDACGMVLRRAWRHLDRGSGEVDQGQWNEAEQVFGATGAAALYRRAALDDVAIPSEDGSQSDTVEIFDPLFHSYREDAELCFRFQERGWQVTYEPAALCTHRRSVVPTNRREVDPAINRHSLKNRYLLRAYHQSWGNLLRTLPWTLARDVAALVWVLLAERSSLGAYAWLWRNRKNIVARARAIRARRTVPWHEVERWFDVESEPL